MNEMQMKLLQDNPQLASSFMRFWFKAWLIGVAIGTLCWTYTLNKWLAYADKTTTVSWWQCLLISLVPVLGPLSLPIAVITWILMLFLA